MRCGAYLAAVARRVTPHGMGAMAGAPIRSQDETGFSREHRRRNFIQEISPPVFNPLAPGRCCCGGPGCIGEVRFCVALRVGPPGSSAVGSAPALGAGGRGFKSPLPDKETPVQSCTVISWAPMSRGLSDSVSPVPRNHRRSPDGGSPPHKAAIIEAHLDTVGPEPSLSCSRHHTVGTSATP